MAALSLFSLGFCTFVFGDENLEYFAVFDVASQVKLTIMIEDPRDVERKRLLGIEDPDELTRDDLADALVEVIYSL
jgi:hypothetical protein